MEVAPLGAGTDIVRWRLDTFRLRFDTTVRGRFDASRFRKLTKNVRAASDVEKPSCVRVCRMGNINSYLPQQIGRDI